MSDMHDQPAQQPRSGAARGTTAAEPSAASADATRGYVPRPAPGYDDVRAASDGPRGAALGLTILASVLMMISGMFGFFEGLAALIKGSFFVVLPNYAYSLSATGWGWLHLILGALVFVAGVALLADQLWARIAGVVLASFQTIASFVFLPYYPVWGIVVIALSLFVIWALLTPRNR